MRRYSDAGRRPNRSPVALEPAGYPDLARAQPGRHARLAALWLILVGREIKQRVRDELNLTASVGIAPNKFLAKMASDHGKPDGLLIVRAGEEAEFLRDLPVREIFGVGKVTARRMTEQGIHTIGQLAERSRERLRQTFGKQGERLYELARGIDDSDVVADTEAKSISHETTFDVDIGDEKHLRATIGLLADRVSARLRQEELVGSTIGVKVRLADFTTLTREKTLKEPVNADNEILTIAWRFAGKSFSYCRLSFAHWPLIFLSKTGPGG